MTTPQNQHCCYKCKNKLYTFDIDTGVSKYYKILMHGYVRQSTTKRVPDVIIVMCLYYFYYFIQESQTQTYNTFEEMGLKANLLNDINQCGLKNTCGHKQVGILPIIQMADTVLLMQYNSAHTCKSTIITYIIGILQRINTNELQCQAIILAPTKELVSQIQTVMDSLNKYLKATTEMYVDTNIEYLYNIQIIISTPVIINTILSKNYLQLNALKILLIHEIDKMLSIGLQDILSRIFKYVPSHMQFICTASKTNSALIQSFTNKFMCNPKPITFETNIDETFQSFDNMNLNENILRGIYAYGFELPSRVQKYGIVEIIKKYDILVQTQSGTGKTSTYCIGALQRIDLNDPQCQALIIVPTRELAMAVHYMCKSLGAYLNNLTTCACSGGNRVRNDINQLLNGVQIIFGTQGRINDMITRGALQLNKLKLFILDEMDEMLSRGFKQQIVDCHQHVPATTQIAVFSTTMPKDLLKLVNPWMRDTAYIFAKKTDITLDNIKQYYVAVEKEHYKFETLYDLFETIKTKHQTVIYCNTRRKVIWLADKMCGNKDIFNVAIHKMHGDMWVPEREIVMKEFREDRNAIMVTTDLLARGINLKTVSLIINYDLPMNTVNYIHRVGITGNRYHDKIIAISFAMDVDEPKLRDIETFYDTKIEELPMDIIEIMCQHPNHE